MWGVLIQSIDCLTRHNNRTLTTEETMTRHEKTAKAKGMTLIKIEGRFEWWETRDGQPKIYDRDRKRWTDACMTVR